jgi:hypothetical protein
MVIFNGSPRLSANGTKGLDGEEKGGGEGKSVRVYSNCCSLVL